MLPLSDNVLHWLFVLSTALVFALLGLLAPNLFAQISNKRRSHNKIKFANEFLGRHQLSYITYLLGVCLTSNFKSFWVHDALILLNAITFISYLIGTYFVHIQDRVFQPHSCDTNPSCQIALSTWNKFRLLGYNAIAGPVLLLLCIWVAFTVSK